MNRRRIIAAMTAMGTGAAITPAVSDTPRDSRVKALLDEKRHQWSRGINYWNIRYEDGQALHDWVVRRGFRRLLEIGTSTGHSGIWLAWAAAKTGGRLTTIEIDAERHREATRNFRLAGLEAFVDARLGDAHVLAPSLPGPWDFVFQDADKEWYLNYWNALKDKIAPGGCYAADNVLRPQSPEVSRFVAAARADSAFDTRIDDHGSGEGVLMACRR